MSARVRKWLLTPRGAATYFLIGYALIIGTALLLTGCASPPGEAPRPGAPNIFN